MSLSEVVEAAKALSRAEKVHLLHVLVDDVGGAGGLTPEEALFAQPVPAGVTIELVTPALAPEDAAVRSMLDSDPSQS